jgi:hypothetical protein
LQLFATTASPTAKAELAKAATAASAIVEKRISGDFEASYDCHKGKIGLNV